MEQPLKESFMYFRAVRHEVRQKMLEEIEKAGEINVTDLYVKLRLDNKTLCSQHLAILKAAGVVKSRKEGNFVLYSINKEELEKATKISNELISLKRRRYAIPDEE